MLKNQEPTRQWQFTPQPFQKQALMPPPQQPRNLFLNQDLSTHLHATQGRVDPSRGDQAQSAPRRVQSNGAEKNNYAGRSDIAGVGRRVENNPPRHLSQNPFINGTRE
ncbi:hypothetical protein GcC1_016039 [Golovinomyces cichoracearum]|uniref:Uncharacterized protein n=1 Tax=Golovinomyces cichoracearum TaxID=62708 RepID=A0A420J672_9PEZI|nr:hypothetical protein GcC1_016039 [Golovinomyces cichoracearum]